MSNQTHFFKNKNSKPGFPVDDDYRFEVDWIDDDVCPNCDNKLSEHTRTQIRGCALERIRGIPPYVSKHKTIA